MIPTNPELRVNASEQKQAQTEITLLVYYLPVFHNRYGGCYSNGTSMRLRMVIVFVNGCSLSITFPKVYLAFLFYQDNLVSLFWGKYVNLLY